MLLNCLFLPVSFDICRRFRTIRGFPINFSSFISFTFLSLLSNVAAEHEGQRNKDESDDESHMTQVLCPGRVKCISFIYVWLCYLVDEPINRHHDAIGPLLLPPNLVFCMREVNFNLRRLIWSWCGRRRVRIRGLFRWSGSRCVRLRRFCCLIVLQVSFSFYLFVDWCVESVQLGILYMCRCFYGNGTEQQW